MSNKKSSKDKEDILIEEKVETKNTQKESAKKKLEKIKDEEKKSSKEKKTSKNKEKTKQPKDYVIPHNQENLEIAILGRLSSEPVFLVNNFVKRGLKRYGSVESAVKAYNKLYNRKEEENG